MHGSVVTICLAQDFKTEVQRFEENGTAPCISNIWNWKLRRVIADSYVCPSYMYLTQVRNLPVVGVVKKQCYYKKAGMVDWQTF